jgi:hypothetical protein
MGFHHGERFQILPSADRVLIEVLKGALRLALIERVNLGVVDPVLRAATVLVDRVLVLGDLIERVKGFGVPIGCVQCKERVRIGREHETLIHRVEGTQLVSLIVGAMVGRMLGELVGWV